jgi:putative membrane protein
MNRPEKSTILIMALIVVLGLLIVSGLHPYDRATWCMEVFPIVLGIPLLVATHRRFPLTPLLYFLIFAHALVLMVGGAYTYARVPLGFQLQSLLELDRNPYDKIGHFMQGLVPALVAREILLRGNYVKGNGMLSFIVISIVLAISATYELLEWAAALLLGQGAEAFLGTQGDVWDTQSDMFFALIGGVSALLVFSRIQDRQIQKVLKEQTPINQ